MGMVDWELTAKTIYCESTGDEVTMLVSADGTCRCTGCEKHPCTPADCAVMIRYRDEQLGKEDPAR